MTAGKQKLLLVSDFNLANFAAILKSKLGSKLECEVAPLDNVVQVLHGIASETELLFLWTRLERVAPGFQKALHFAQPDYAQILADVDSFANLVIAASQKLKTVYIPLWQINPGENFGPREMCHSSGVYNILLQMNARLSERLAEAQNITVMNSTRWLQAAGNKAWSSRMWYLAKTPFSEEVFVFAANDFVAYVNHSTGSSIKLVVLDLDDTLWGGVVGDDGWQNLRLGGHDATGESFVDFQRTLKSLKERGILLAIVSKNEASAALEAMEKHPEMVLHKDDFVAMRIDWNDKESNIKAVVNELNIGLQSVMFIDDNPVERSRVKEFLPEVTVPDWPENKLLYTEKLRSLPVFNFDAISKEDLTRTQLYVEEKKREQLKSTFEDVEAWLQSLETCVEASRINEADLQRVHQLFSKTNQFNLTTRRLSVKELREWMGHKNHQLWSFRVRDRFGDAGLTGIIGIDLGKGNKAVISDLILSCRVLGRKIEETLMHVACKIAKEAQKDTVEAKFIPTAKNKPCLEFMQRSGFETRSNEYDFDWNLARTYACPPSIQLLFK